MVHLILQKEYCLSDPTLHAVESMAFDGSHYLFCDGKSPSVFEINRSSMVRTIRNKQDTVTTPASHCWNMRQDNTI